jgi:ribosomal protein L11 methyltransferase
VFELVLRAPEALVEQLCDALIEEADALSVSVEDADAGSQHEQALFGEPGMPAPRPGWERSTLKALFENEAAATDAATLVKAQDWAHEVSLLALAPVADEDWVRLTQSQFAPVAVTETFWVVPSWHEPPPQARRVIRLDPGLAFGTGTHPTWDRVLDYGCGSGILAIGAALHGARGIDAVDIDPAAVQATQANALANGVTLRGGLPAQASGAYALVLANILASPLKLLAPLLCAHLRPAGQLVLAGILERQAHELQEAYAPWLALQVADAEDGWILMTAER